MADQEQTTWQYKADATEPKAKTGARAVSWTASEYIDHQQGPLWYLLLFVLTVGLSVGFYFLTHDYFAVGATVVVGLLVGVFAKRTPEKLNYQLSADGLKIEQKNYPLSQFKSFSIVEEGPVSSLEFIPLKKFMPPLSAFFETAQKDKIVAVLENYLPFEDRQLDTVERLARRLRF